MTPLYGAPDPADRNRTPPNGAVTVANVTELGNALNTTPSGGTIVLEAGTWPVSIRLPRGKALTIQNEPGAHVILDGSTTAPPELWRRDGMRWWLPFDPLDHTPLSDLTIDPEVWWSSWPEQVWDGDTPLTMVEPGTWPGPGEYMVDVGNGRIWIGSNPAAVDDLRVGVRPVAITGAPDARLDVYGLDIVRYVTPTRLIAAVTMFGTGSTVEACSIRDCSAAGISARGQEQTIHQTDLVNCGQLGGHAWRADDLTISHSLAVGNNRRGFVPWQQAGGFKLVQCQAPTITHSLARSNNGHNWWLDIDTDGAEIIRTQGFGGHSGIFLEISRDGMITGCCCEDNWVGIYLAGSDVCLVGHNTCRNNRDGDIVNRADQRNDRDPNTNTLTGNDRSGVGVAVPPTPTEARLLELTEDQASVAWHGWYGPQHITPPPPEETPDVYDVEPLTQSVGEAVEEIRRLEAIIANDDHQTTIDELARLYYLTAVDLNAERAVTASQQQTIASQQMTIEELTHDVAEAQGERDTAQAATEEAQELLAESEATVARQAETVTAQSQVIEGQHTTIANFTDELGRVTAERDEALTEVQWLNDRVSTLEHDLAECEEGHDPDPPLDPIIVGGSHKNGWQALKAMTAPETPGAYRKFIAQARISGPDMTTINGVATDGAVPFISPQRGNAADTRFNCEALITAGHNRPDRTGVYCQMHEPTTGKAITAPEFIAMYVECMPIVADLLPTWHRVPCFQAFDFADDSLPRYPANWLPADLTLIDGLGVDVYDSGNADGNGDGRHLPDLLANVEALAVDLGLQIWIMECSAPDTGQKPGNPAVSNPRRAGWKPDWLDIAWQHAQTATLPDGRRLYRSLLTFNSDVGQNSPAAVVGPPPVKAGWYWDTTPEALAVYRGVIAEARNT